MATLNRYVPLDRFRSVRPTLFQVNSNSRYPKFKSHHVHVSFKPISVLLSYISL